MKYPMFKVHMPVEEAIEGIRSVLNSGFVNEGKQVLDFQTSLMKFLGVENLVLTNSCTSALTMAFKICGVQNGYEVITPAMTCVATNTPIVNLGGKIVWSDIDPQTGCVSCLDIEKKINEKTKAIVSVNWAGTPNDLEKLRRLADNYNLPIIQDSAHAFGATWDGHPISDYADFTCYSFQAIKHLTSGDGGALVCNSKDHFDLARKLKWFGYDRDSVKDEKGEWKGQRWSADILNSEVGFKFNMNNISAAIGIAQMSYIPKLLDMHRNNADVYRGMFEKTKKIKPLTVSQKAQSSFWVYTCLFDGPENQRDMLIEQLNAEGIAAGLVHLPNNIYSAFDKFKRDLPGTDKFSSTQISLPCGWWLSKTDCEFIAERVIDIANKVSA